MSRTDSGPDHCGGDFCLECTNPKPWPGYCQNCGAALNPPDATFCDTCHADDEDET